MSSDGNRKAEKRDTLGPLVSQPLQAVWRVVVAGRVVRVRAREDGGWRVRLADTGGALAAAEFRRSHPQWLPPVGAFVVVAGCLLYDRDHRWYAVDPVEEWRAVSLIPVYGLDLLGQRLPPAPARGPFWTAGGR